MAHQAKIVEGSAKTTAHGVSFVISCCGVHEHSVHIQRPGKYTQDELLRLKEDALRQAANDHADILAAACLFGGGDDYKGCCE